MVDSKWEGRLKTTLSNSALTFNLPECSPAHSEAAGNGKWKMRNETSSPSQFRVLGFHRLKSVLLRSISSIKGQQERQPPPALHALVTSLTVLKPDL